VETCQDLIEQFGQPSCCRRGKVLQFLGDLGGAFCLGRRADRDPQVPDELGATTQGVPFHNVQLDGERGTTKLIKQCIGSGVIGFARYGERMQRKFAGALPSDQ